MTEHRLTVEQGGEYRGETYLWCCHGPNGTDAVFFQGESVDELLAFLREHGAEL